MLRFIRRWRLGVLTASLTLHNLARSSGQCLTSKRGKVCHEIDDEITITTAVHLRASAV
jgi:hypothetical protein